jgi:hypothetical protein
METEISDLSLNEGGFVLYFDVSLGMNELGGGVASAI